MGPERGTDCDEGKTLKGEAHGRSDAQASGGPEVRVAKGVTKPRTWPRGGGGIRCRSTYPPAWDCVVGQEKSRRGSVVRPAGRPAGRHGFPVIGSEGERKSKEGHPRLRPRVGVSVECPQDVKRRTGRVETNDHPGSMRPSPRRAAQLHESRRGSPQGGRRSHPEPYSSGGPRRCG